MKDKNSLENKPNAALIEVSNMDFQKQRKIILKHVNIRIKTGALYVIIGANGAGKSTLLKVLAREEFPEKGNIFFKGEELENWKDPILPFHKAKFSQEFNPNISLRVGDIVMMGRYPYFHSSPRDMDHQVVDRMLAKVDLQSHINRLYNTLSGGEKQRVHLARVMAQLENEITPKVAFFDEPLNNLDVRHQHRILEEIKTFTAKGHTALVVLHDLNLAAAFADRIILMKEGEIMAQGIPKQIFTAELMQKAYDFPCMVCANPIYQCPMIVFKKEVNPTLTF